MLVIPHFNIREYFYSFYLLLYLFFSDFIFPHYLLAIIISHMNDCWIEKDDMKWYVKCMIDSSMYSYYASNR